MTHLRAKDPGRPRGRLHRSLRPIGRVPAEIGQKPIWSVDRIRHLISHGLVQRNRPCMTLNRMMLWFALTVQLFAFPLALLTFAMRQFLLALAFDQLPLP